eukprot:CAMPEP_0202474326 /NCGR_PEP_ID=MMETSP1360-20130828/92324_1 /ASSEMBLY_ACC=CAM_ASM_000848 /TAXON_ID=515479 /ORGANISM="Licmophora paradoxa, Strain CCMP2313" /LENGTH=156 /DNA_ID=CAMNT_0049101445 /DNA_START=243 /DNA_END=712 /DNA_ORIENTATION=-
MTLAGIGYENNDTTTNNNNNTKNPPQKKKKAGIPNWLKYKHFVSCHPYYHYKNTKQSFIKASRCLFKILWHLFIGDGKIISNNNHRTPIALFVVPILFSYPIRPSPADMSTAIHVSGRKQQAIIVTMILILTTTTTTTTITTTITNHSRVDSVDKG